MEIECPHCSSSNIIEFAENISCNECEKSFKGFTFRKKKWLSAGSALALGLYSGYKATDTFSEKRYPLEVEYAIVDSCVNSSRNMVSAGWYDSKRELCLCALDKTMRKVPYSDYEESESKFVAELRKQSKHCR